MTGAAGYAAASLLAWSCLNHAAARTIDNAAPVVEVACDGIDDTALIATTLARLGVGPASRAVVHGKCNIQGALPEQVYAGIGVELSGDGVEGTVFTFAGATDGLRIRLDKGPAGWASFVARDFSVVRGPSRPVRANTGLLVYANPATGTAYTGYSGFSDLVIRGNPQRTTQWRHGMVLSGLTSVSLVNINIQGPGADSTDQGDAQLTLDGPNRAMFGTSYAIANSTFQGGSVGLDVTGYVQGVFCTNCTIIGQYDSVRWLGAGPPAAHQTTEPTPSGRSLHFAPGSLGGISVGDIVNGAGIVAQSRVTAVDDGAGTLGIDPAILHPMAAGARIDVRAYRIAEDFGMTTSTLNASHRDVYLEWGSLSRVADTTMIRYGNGGPDWAAVEIEEGNNNLLHGLNILGAFSGHEAGIVLSSIGPQGASSPNAAFGNIISSVSGPGVLLKGTTANVVAAFNNVNGAAAGVVADAEGTNAILGNRFNNGTPDLTQDTRTGALLVNRPMVFAAAPPGPPRIACDSGPATIDLATTAMAGSFKAGEGSTRCTVAWPARLAQAPHCTAGATTPDTMPFIRALSATEMVIGFSGSHGGGVSYICVP